MLPYGVPLTQLAAAEKVGERTLQRWLAAYRKGGIAALAPAAPPKRGRRTHPDLVAYIEGLALGKSPGVVGFGGRGLG